MKTCPKCSYQRKPEDDEFISLAECPRCGVVYDRFKSDHKEEQAGVEPTDNASGAVILSTKVRNGWRFSKLVISAAILVLFLSGAWITTSLYQSKKQHMNAYKAIKKIQASVTSGTNFQDYGRAVNDAKLELCLIKDRSGETEKLDSICRTYQLSKEAWNSKLFGDWKAKRNLVKEVIAFLDIPRPAPDMMSGLILFVDTAADALIDKFGITTKTESTLKESYDDNIMDYVNQILWHEASKMIIQYETTWPRRWWKGKPG